MIKFQSSTVVKGKRPSLWEEVRGPRCSEAGSQLDLNPLVALWLLGFTAPKLSVRQPPQLYSGQFSSGKRKVSLHKMFLADYCRFPNTEEDTQMANKHMKRCSASLTIREMQIKSTMRWHYTAIRMPKIKNDTTKCLCGLGETIIHTVLVRMWNGTATPENNLTVS